MIGDNRWLARFAIFDNSPTRPAKHRNRCAWMLIHSASCTNHADWSADHAQGRRERCEIVDWLTDQLTRPDCQLTTGQRTTYAWLLSTSKKDGKRRQDRHLWRHARAATGDSTEYPCYLLRPAARLKCELDSHSLQLETKLSRPFLSSRR
jgi:hypothetical protein